MTKKKLLTIKKYKLMKDEKELSTQEVVEVMNDVEGIEAVDPSTTTVAVAEEIADTEVKLSRLQERLRKRRPDAEYENEEVEEDAFYEDYDSMEAENRKFTGDNNKLSEIVRENPELSVLFRELMAGTPLKVALIKAQIDLPDPQEGEENFEEYTKAHSEKNQRMTDAKKREDKYKEDFAVSQEVIEKFFKDMGLSEQGQKEYEDYVDNVVIDVVEGRFTEEILTKLYQGMMYKEHVEQAQEAGKVDGLNTAIETKREKKTTQTDNLASAGAGGAVEEPAKKVGYIERMLNPKR